MVEDLAAERVVQEAKQEKGDFKVRSNVREM